MLAAVQYFMLITYNMRLVRSNVKAYEAACALVMTDGTSIDGYSAVIIVVITCKVKMSFLRDVQELNCC
jgi:hypothetical protein